MKYRMESAQGFPRGTIITPDALDALVGQAAPFRDGQGNEVGTSTVTGWRVDAADEVRVVIEYEIDLPQFKPIDPVGLGAVRPFHKIDDEDEGESPGDRARRALSPQLRDPLAAGHESGLQGLPEGRPGGR